MRHVIRIVPPERGSNRPAQMRALARRLVRAGALVLVAAVAAVSFVAWELGWFGWTGTQLWRAAVTVGSQAGLAVGEIVIEGRERTTLGEVTRALAVRWSQPILAFEPTAAKRRLEDLPWVREAEVGRRLPTTLRVRLAERLPFALWQRGGRFALIDRDGVVILDDTGTVAAYASLPVVVGEGANEGAAALVALLASVPDLGSRITSAVRVANRRWNLSFDTGVDVLLPEIDAGLALRRLAGIEERHGLLERRVGRIDMRLPDRLVVRIAESEEEQGGA